MEKFEPGDRVIWHGKKHRDALWEDHAGTVNGPYDIQPGRIVITFDGDNDHQTTVMSHNLKRQPVEPGCHVRWSKAGTDYLDVSRLKVEWIEAKSEWSGQQVVHLEGDKEVWLHDIVRIAEPKPERNAGAQLSELGTDAAKWSAEFVKVLGKLGNEALDGSPGGTVFVWFANAIEAGRSAGYAEGEKPVISSEPIASFELGGIKLEAFADGTSRTVFIADDMHVLESTGHRITDEVRKLGDFITEHHPDKIVPDKGPADTAIELIEQIDKLGRFLINNGHVPETSPIIRNPVDEAIEVIERLSPRKPTYKRGDKVRITSSGHNLLGVVGRIIREPGKINGIIETVEIMDQNDGSFFPNIPIDAIEHV